MNEIIFIIIAVFLYAIIIPIALVWIEKEFEYDHEFFQLFCATFWIITLPVYILSILPQKIYGFLKKYFEK